MCSSSRREEEEWGFLSYVSWYEKRTLMKFTRRYLLNIFTSGICIFIYLYSLFQNDSKQTLVQDNTFKLLFCINVLHGEYQSITLCGKKNRTPDPKWTSWGEHKTICKVKAACRFGHTWWGWYSVHISIQKSAFEKKDKWIRFRTRSNILRENIRLFLPLMLSFLFQNPL